jgi:hypothetical protein
MRGLIAVAALCASDERAQRAATAKLGEIAGKPSGTSPTTAPDPVWDYGP